VSFGFVEKVQTARKIRRSYLTDFLGVHGTEHFKGLTGWGRGFKPTYGGKEQNGRKRFFYKKSA